MIITADISMYPLNENFLAQIDAFIRDLMRNQELKVIVQSASTLVIGPSREVFSSIQKGIETHFENHQQAAFVMKVLSGDLAEKVDLSPYA